MRITEGYKAGNAMRSHEEKALEAASAIIAEVRKNGDKALVSYTNEFDDNSLSPDELKVTPEEVESATEQCSQELLTALRFAAGRIRRYHEKQIPPGTDYIDEVGVRLGARWIPVESAGIYVPGGKAAYPSSVLMNAIPAFVAGVKRVAMVVPAPGGSLSPVILAAAKIAGITEIYKIGGAQAVAALAYGTSTVPKVDKIAGPGNAYVAAAKKLVFGDVGIDTIAGPSEILVIADKNNNPDWVAADLLSQAEHDENARPLLITDNREFAESVRQAVEKILPNLSRRAIAEVSIKNNGLIILVKNMTEAAEAANKIAPEHLELMVEDPGLLAARISNAGAIFFGKYTPEAIGDYTAGPSHVLPTAGSARFSSGLSVHDFLKRQSIIGCTKKSFFTLAGPAEILANAEGLNAHALSLSIRKNEN